ncbi:hypothetical protein C0991_009071, partial [Blastosporella zonata]
SPTRISPFTHFRNITRASCIVCRINSPSTSLGLLTAKRLHRTPNLHIIPLCPMHDRRPLSFCGLCLRAAHPHASYDHNPMSDIVDNDDKDAFPAVDATCRSCRHECLYKRAADTPGDLEALRGWVKRGAGGAGRTRDWEVKAAIEAFVDLGEGTVRDVLGLAREKMWLAKNTRLDSMLLMLKKSTRVEREGLEYDYSPDPQPQPTQTTFPAAPTVLPQEEEEEEEEEEEFTTSTRSSPTPLSPSHLPPTRSRSRSRSPSFASSTSDDDSDDIHAEEVHLHMRDMALQDWARARILDGHWVSPADSWYGYRGPGWENDWVGAVWPCAWVVPDVGVSFSSSGEDNEEESGADDDDQPGEGEQHPTKATRRGTIPPTYNLCEAAFGAHTRALKEVLLPPMRNLMRKIVIECQTPDMASSTSGTQRPRNSKAKGRTEDPAIRAAKMGVEDVLEALRNEEGVWLEGFDWVGRWRSLCEEREGEASSPESIHSSSFSPLEREERDTEQWHPPQDRPIDNSDDSSSSSSSSSVGSRSSNATSPVLSTTTLQTTPSPPPIHGSKQKQDREGHEEEEEQEQEEEEEEDGQEEEEKNVPRIETWREACAPLYRCRCSICLRAAARAHAAVHPPQQQQSYVPQPQPHQESYPPPPRPTPTQPPQSPKKTANAKIGVQSLIQPIEALPTFVRVEREKEVTTVRLEEFDGQEEEGMSGGEEEGEEEEEEEYDDDVDVDVEDGEGYGGYEELGSDVADVDSGEDVDLEVDADADADVGLIQTMSPPPLALHHSTTTARKRSSDELELEGTGESTGSGDSPSGTSSTRSGTPPKRARTGELIPLILAQAVESPRRMRKRRSEELEEGADAEEGGEGGHNKKIRVGGARGERKGSVLFGLGTAAEAER